MVAFFSPFFLTLRKRIYFEMMRTFLAFTFVLFILANTCYAAPKVVRLAMGEWPPMLSKSLPDNGEIAEKVSAAFNDKGIEVEYVFLPWKRALQYAKQGEGDGQTIHGSMLWLKNAEREKYFFFSEPAYSGERVLYSLVGTNIEFVDQSLAVGTVVGVTSHSDYPRLNELIYHGVVVQRAGSYDVLFSRLLKKRIDAVALNSQSGEFYLNSHMSPDDKAKITRVNVPGKNRDFYVIFSRRHNASEALVAILNDALN